MFQTKLAEKIKKHFVLSKFLFSENVTVHDIMWKNMVRHRQATNDNIKRHEKMRFACRMSKVRIQTHKYNI
jgi:hypothetical protein